MVDFVARVREAHPDLVISVDTWRAEVGARGLRGRGRPAQRRLGRRRPGAGRRRGRARRGPRLHARRGVTPRTRPHRIEYDDVVADRDRRHRRATPSARSPPASTRRAILIDPAHDFGKNTCHSLELTRRLDEMVATGWPVLVSLSQQGLRRRDPRPARGRAAHRHAGRHRRLRAGRAPGSTACTRSSRPGRPSTWSGRSPGRRPPQRAIRGLQ